MNILICIPTLLTGGTEIQTLNLVRALTGGGHRVTTLCYFEFQPEMVATYRSAGSEVICLSGSGERIGGWRGILFLWRGLRDTVKRVRPDAAHVQYMAPGAIPIVILRLLGVRQLLATAHTAADIYPSLRLVHFVQRHCVRAFTCITLAAEESFFGSSQLYTPAIRLKKRNHFTIHNALPAYIEPRTDARTFGGPITLGVVSRLEPIKGMDLVIPAFAQIKRRFPDVRLLIVGEGSLLPEMERQTQQAELTQIEWAGRQPQHNLQALYDRIDILLMPSRSEGFGLTAIEGMARGCAVVAARTGGLPEVVSDGECGLLHTPESIDDISQLVVRLLESPDLLGKISRQAQTRALKYLFDDYARLFNDLYNKLG